MKKISVLLLAVLFSTAVFARGTFENPAAAKNVAVVKQGENVFKVFYKGDAAGQVKVAIYNSKHKLVFAETLNARNGFARPYNFDGLAEGDYSIEISDLSGKQVEKICYHAAPDLVNVMKLSGKDDRYLLTVAGKNGGKVNINIFDENYALIHSEIKSITKDFGRIYNLKNVKGRITFEVSGRGGSKIINY